MRTVIILILSLLSLIVEASKIKGPSDLYSFTGQYKRVKCVVPNGTTRPEIKALPRTIEFQGNESGAAHIVLNTSEKILTSRHFDIQEGEKQKCFEEANYTAKCRARYEEGLLSVRINWNCEGRFLLLFCMAQTPKDYSFLLNNNGTLSYTQDEAQCVYTRVE